MMRITFLIILIALAIFNINFAKVSKIAAEVVGVNAVDVKVSEGKLLERTLYVGIEGETAYGCIDIKNCPDYINNDEDSYKNFLDDYYKEIKSAESAYFKDVEGKCDLSRIKEGIATFKCLLANLDKIDKAKCEIKECSFYGNKFLSNVDKDWLNFEVIFMKTVLEVEGTKYIKLLARSNDEGGGDLQPFLLKEVDEGYYKLIYGSDSGFDDQWPYHTSY